MTKETTTGQSGRPSTAETRAVQEKRLAAVLARYVDGFNAGVAPRDEELLREHSDIRGDLKEALRAFGKINELLELHQDGSGHLTSDI